MSVYPVRIINVDFYMAHPIQEMDVMYSDFRSSATVQIPIIRIFGSTDTGKKICLHIHGVFPYLYIPYDGLDDANTLIYQIAASIDKAVNVSFGQTSSTTQHVYKISLVSGIPFYGYHKKEHQFFKVWLYNPALIRKVSNLLQSETILGKIYQPHESHIPFILQFMIDYNLHGMSKILLKEIKFRVNSDESLINNSNLLLPSSVQKLSICELEGDALAKDIINQLEVASGKLTTNPGIAALWEDEKQRRRNRNDNSQIESCLTMVNFKAIPTKSHLIFRRALLDKLSMLDDSAEKTDLNVSVYPAETPSDKNIMNASIIEFHSPSSSESINRTVDMNATLDNDAQNLFEILHDLVEKAEVEEDSILSQVNNEDEEDYLDLSIPMAVTTPVKIMVDDETGNSDDDLWNNSLSTTVLQQLDGNYDDSSSSDDSTNKKSQLHKIKRTSKCKGLPICILPSKSGKQSQEMQESQKVVCDNYAKVKRKLSFVNNPSCADITEENISCQFKPEYKENIVNTYNTLIANEYFPSQQEYNNSKYSSELKKAYMYDMKTKFEPKEGSSKNLTQNSVILESKLSLEGNKLPKKFNANVNLNLLHQQKDASGRLNKDKTLSCSKYLIVPQHNAPSRSDVINSLEKLKISKIFYQPPYYSNVDDVTGSVEIGHSVLKIPSKTTMDLEEFRTIFNGLDDFRKLTLPSGYKWNHSSVKNYKLTFCKTLGCIISPVQQTPTRKDINTWIMNRNNNEVCQKVNAEKPVEKTKVYLPLSPARLDESDLEMSLTISPCDKTIEMSQPKSKEINSPVLGKGSKKRKVLSDNSNLSAITGVTLNNTYGFKITPENYQNARALNEFQYLTVLSLELHICTRGELKPDPKYDPVKAIFYSIFEDAPATRNKSGIIAINSFSVPGKGKFAIKEENCDIVYVESEDKLFEEFVKFATSLNPDILCGYEIEMLSWGYLIERACVLGINLVLLLSRTKDKVVRCSDEEKGLKITGRIMLDVWRLLRHEIALQSYTFENVAYHILHKRVPLYSFKDLSFWWDHCSSLYRHRTVSHYMLRVKGTLKIMEQLDIIGRTSELARLFGIQFYEVLSRGSQFRVESMMLRLAKPLNFIPVSPSVQQRATMKAPEFLPLILEPESKLYVDPVIVLDFQSLYPSMIIAYNYCFSTCIGKVQHLGKNTPFEFGATQYRIPKKIVEKLVNGDCLNFSPCGVAFVKSHIREGVLPRMLREILDTRLMVKNSMKENKDDKILQKVLHNRQLGLKLIANVTYGYTAANFSGRMPAVEVGDSVVSKGRETLQRAIAMVENTPEWGAKVVYGDTDSLFVLVSGKTKSEAFEVGKKIAEAVTNDNPDPVKLKLEKIYLPCILQTKKRYVGYMYESLDQEEPIYDAKGIETVRRDGCPAVSKILEKCLRLLFETRNVSLIKKYVLRQFHKILSGRISLQDLTFAKEYRGASGYRPGACVPALELARKWTAVDKRNEPRCKERVPYAIANGPPGLPLIRLVHSPRDFLNNPSLRPNVLYYITRVIIPPINRCLNLIGADLNVWFNQMPRKHYLYLPTSSPGKKNTISQYFSSTNCAVCGQQTQTGVCEHCINQPQSTVIILFEKMRKWEQAYYNMCLVCHSCSGIAGETPCISLDCPILHRLSQATRDLEQTVYVRQLLNSLEYEF